MLAFWDDMFIFRNRYENEAGEHDRVEHLDIVQVLELFDRFHKLLPLISLW
jgi:hypothetical protein